MRFSQRMWMALAAILLLSVTLGMPIAHHTTTAQAPIQISNITTPEEASQASQGQVSATVYNSVNQTFDGFAQFTDQRGQITSELINFTIGYNESRDITVEYYVADEATLGLHQVTFEINVNGFAFLFHQYELEVTPVATITAFTPGQVFFQGQVGILIVTINNHAPKIQTVRIDLFGPAFINASHEIDLAPGSNTVAVSLQHNASHFYDFGMYPVNLTLYYQNELIGSSLTTVPVDMLPVNKAIGIIAPVLIFELLVIFYAVRKLQRSRQLSAGE